MAYAIIHTGGKQYRVSEGDKIDVERLALEAGDTATFDRVLAVGNASGITVGSPVVAGATVTATVIEQHRAPKVIAFKYKRRKGFHKTKGHRRHLTRVQIQAISA